MIPVNGALDVESDALRPSGNLESAEPLSTLWAADVIACTSLRSPNHDRGARSAARGLRRATRRLLERGFGRFGGAQGREAFEQFQGGAAQDGGGFGVVEDFGELVAGADGEQGHGDRGR